MAIQPHGGTLIHLFQPNYEVSAVRHSVELDATALRDLELIGIGAYSPLTGFLSQEDYDSVVENMRLKDGTVWSIPITLPVNENKASSIKIGEEAKLVYHGEVYGVIRVEDKFKPDKEKEAECVFMWTYFTLSVSA